MSTALTDDDERTIVSIVQKVGSKHMDGSSITAEKLSNLQKELSGRLNDAGYDVTVDVSPLLRGQPPTVAINGRAETQEDMERKLWDIKKRLDKNDPDPQIEGRV